MVLMVSDTCQPLDDSGHSPGGPKRGAKGVGFGPLLERAFQLAEVLVGQTGLAPGSSGPFESAGAMVLPSLMPAVGGLPVDAHGAGDLGLAQALVEEFNGLHPPPFQLCKLCRIALYAFWIAHAQRLPPGQRFVTILCRDQ